MMDFFKNIFKKKKRKKTLNSNQINKYLKEMKDGELDEKSLKDITNYLDDNLSDIVSSIRRHI